MNYELARTLARARQRSLLDEAAARRRAFVSAPSRRSALARLGRAIASLGRRLASLGDAVAALAEPDTGGLRTRP